MCISSVQQISENSNKFSLSNSDKEGTKVKVTEPRLQILTKIAMLFSVTCNYTLVVTTLVNI